MAQSTAAVTSGADAGSDWATGVVNDFTKLYADSHGPFDDITSPIPYSFDVMPTSGVNAFAVGGFNSNGWFNNGHPYCLKDHYQTTLGAQAGWFSTNSTTPGNVAGNIPILLPPHGALTVTRLDGFLSIALASHSASYTATIESVDIILISVDESTGAETTLETTNVAGLFAVAGQTSETTRFAINVALNAGVGYSILATERLGIRIKVYGRSNNASGMAWFIINGVGGSKWDNLYGLPADSKMIFTIT